MARIVYQDDFKDRIINSTKKIIGIGALAFLMTGCQTTMDYQPSLDEINNVPYKVNINDKMELAASKVPRIDSSNFKEIIEEKKSGVYRHPVYPDQIITYQFAEEPNSEIEIKAQLAKLGLSPSAFDDENRLYNLVTSDGATTSRHVQNYFGNKENDINLCKIFQKNVELEELNEEQKEYEKILGFELNDYTDEEIKDLEKFEMYRNYNLLMHEAAHSLKHQQMKAIDYLNPDVYIMLENSAESFASIKTIQLMSEMGETQEYIDNYLEGRVQSANNVTKNILGGRKNDPHQHVPTANIIKDITKTDINYILNLSDDEVDKFSEIVAKESVNHNFAEMYTDDLIKKIEEKVIDFFEDADQFSKKELQNLKENFEERISTKDYKSQKDELEEKRILILIDIALDKFEYIKEAPKGTIAEYALEEIKKRSPSSLDIDEELIVEIENYDPLHKRINIKLETEGMPLPNKEFNNLQDIMHASKSPSKDLEPNKKENTIKSKIF